MKSLWSLLSFLHPPFGNPCTFGPYHWPGLNLPNLGYTSVFPTATIAKIVIAQVLLAMLLQAFPSLSQCSEGQRSECSRLILQAPGCKPPRTG